MTISIRFAGPDDAAILHRFIVELAIYEREPDAVELDEQTLRAQMSEGRPPFECLVAEDEGGTALGFALFFQSYSTWKGRPGLYLEDLFVPEAHRGRGVGKALLVELAAVALSRDYGRMEWAVLDWNTPAIEVYEHLGARPQSDWTTYRLTGDAIRQLAGG